MVLPWIGSRMKSSRLQERSGWKLLLIQSRLRLVFICAFVVKKGEKSAKAAEECCVIYEEEKQRWASGSVTGVVLEYHSGNSNSSYSAYSSNTQTLRVVPKAIAECSFVATNASAVSLT